jgi:hypothetical protein
MLAEPEAKASMAYLQMGEKDPLMRWVGIAIIQEIRHSQ